MRNRELLISLVLFFIIVFVIALILLFISNNTTNNKSADSFSNLSKPVEMKLIKEQIKDFSFITIGDSFTIGAGVDLSENWPNQFSSMMLKDNYKLTQVANLAIFGHRSSDLIAKQLPELKNLKSDLIFILIGTNDYAFGINKNTFQNNIKSILDELLKTYRPENIFLLTIPDFSFSAKGQVWDNGRDLSKGIAEFNFVLKEEALQRSLNLIDLYSTGRDIWTNPLNFQINDRIHPTASGYSIWANTIKKDVLEELKTRTREFKI